jgi:NIMA (never in mitosis gene a)-related kinase
MKGIEQANDIIGKIIEGYKIIKFLGSGKFSVVYEAERQLDSKLVALKIIKIYDIKDKNLVEKCLQEVNLLKRVNHPNIIKYLDSFIYQNELYIAVEWADKGDVKRLIKKYKQEGDEIDERKVIEYTREIAAGLNHMHEQRIIHRDLKPANILITSDGIFKLGDLGLGRIMNTETIKTFSKVGTPLYIAPEVINNSNGYDFKCDNWSLGCVIYELITLRSPFQTSEKLSLIELFKKINSGLYPKIDNNKYKVAAKISEALLKVNPEERMELPQVLKICDEYISKQEEKPRIDPFIIMDDLIEKLRLINYEINFCQKHNHEIINKYYFACNIYGFNFDNKENSTKETYPVQFAYFYDLSNWLMALIKQNANINILQEIDIKFKKYDKKKQQEVQIQELLNDLKNLQIKVLYNSRFKFGYGDGVCLVLTQLCDKYLIKQNFIFKKPKFQDIQEIEKIKEYPDDIPLEENIGTNIGFKSNTNYNFSGYKSIGGGSKSKFFSGQKFKHFASIGPVNDENSTNYSAQAEEENKQNNVNSENAILYSNIPEEDWQKEFNKVSNMLEIAEVSDEYMASFSESSSNNKDSNKNEGNYPTVKYIKNMNKLLDDKLLDDVDVIDNYSKNIEKELNYISNKENKISITNNGLKEELNKLKITKQANIHYQEEYDMINEDIKKMEKEKNKIEFELDKIKKEEKKFLNLDDKNTLQKIKKAVENLYNDNNKLDEEISLVNTVLMNKYSNFLYDNVINSDHSGVNIFTDKNFETKIAENINKEEDVFGEDEII